MFLCSLFFSSTIPIPVKNNINGLIDKMTIEEKVGQMTQINLGFLSPSIDQHDGKVKQIDDKKLEGYFKISCRFDFKCRNCVHS